LEYPGGVKVSYYYGIFGNISQIILEQNNKIINNYYYEFDNLGRLIRVSTDDDSSIFNATYTYRNQYKSYDTKELTIEFAYNFGGKHEFMIKNGVEAKIKHANYSIFPSQIGDYELIVGVPDNLTSIRRGDIQTLFYYDNENKLIGMLDSNGNYYSFHYNPFSKLVRVISKDTIDFEYVKSENFEMYPKVKVNDSIRATYFYNDFFDETYPIGARVDDTTFIFIEDDFGNRLGYLAGSELILEPRFDYFDMSSTNDFLPRRSFIPIPGTDLQYDGKNFYHAHLGIYITNYNNNATYFTPFLEPNTLKNSKTSEKIKYHIDSKLLIGGAEKYRHHIEKILKGNILSDLLLNELNKQFNDFLTFKVSPIVKENKTKYSILMPEDIKKELYYDFIDNQNLRQFEIQPQGIELLADTVFKKAYAGADLNKLINIPKQNGSKHENILEILKYLDYDDNDQLVKVLNLLVKILNIGKVTSPTNIVDLSPLDAPLQLIDSILKAEDYMHQIIFNSIESCSINNSYNNALSALDFYINSIKPPKIKDELKSIDIFSPTVKNFVPNYYFPDFTPEMYYEYIGIQYSNLKSLYSVISNYNKPFNLMPTYNYDSNITLPMYFDTFDNMNLIFVKPFFKNYFDFLR